MLAVRLNPIKKHGLRSVFFNILLTLFSGNIAASIRAAGETSAGGVHILGLLPLALRLSGTSETWGPMATSLVWGLVFASLLNLFVIPVLVAILDDFKTRFLGGHQD